MILALRKLYRLTGIIFPLIYFFTDKRTTVLWLASFTCLFLILELFRFCFPQFNRQIFRKFKAILKEQELGSRFLGSSYFLFGSLLTVLFFEKSLAIASLLFLIFGDAVSALVGARWGKIKIGQRTLEGSLAFLVSCIFIAAILQYTYLHLNFRLALCGALAATLAELLPFPLNDNLSIPLCSAWVMAALG